MNVILLSGGSGKRLWPLSNDIRSKQFIKLFKDEGNMYESMLERMYKNIKKVNNQSTITIATSHTQVSIINNQLGKEIGISIEPCRRDTFPAIVLATAYLHDVKKVPLEESVVVCPVDPYVEEDYFIALEKLYKLSKNSKYNLSLLGINPTYPSEKYGYIIPENKKEVSKVVKFKEKPNTQKAKEYISEGALWNGGIFAYKLKYVLEIAHKLIDFKDYNDLYNKYETLEKISFDYAVVEKEEKIQVMKFEVKWKDLGTWNTLTEAMNENILGKGIQNEKCENTHIINELDVPVLCMGLKNVVVSASSEGILVSDKKQSSYIKPFVEKINQPIMFSEKSWGSYKVINVQENSLTILVTLNSGNKMKYHSHNYRDEVWTIISGNGKAIIDGNEQNVKPGDVITMKAGSKHTIIANDELKVIEVQIGKEISVSDKQEFDK
ncbi:MAG: cupin domain-containing protein [Clostridia bacterium]|nr:cupin domain-containing protein [Clostridia bacterium]